MVRHINHPDDYKAIAQERGWPRVFEHIEKLIRLEKLEQQVVVPLKKAA